MAKRAIRVLVASRVIVTTEDSEITEHTEIRQGEGEGAERVYKGEDLLYPSHSLSVCSVISLCSVVTITRLAINTLIALSQTLSVVRS